MTRSKDVELREAVLAPALALARQFTLTGELSVGWLGELLVAVEALDQHELDEITDSEGASVLGALRHHGGLRSRSCRARAPSDGRCSTTSPAAMTGWPPTR